MTMRYDCAAGQAWDRVAPQLPAARKPVASLTGTVTDPDGRESRGFVVYVEHEKWRGRLGYLPHEQTDERGAFTFYNLPPGRCDVFTNPVGTGQPLLRVKRVELVDGQTQRLHLNLPGGFVIAGRVTTADGKPVPGIEISGHWQSDDGAIEFDDFATTDQEGHYVLKSPLRKATYVGVSGTGKQPRPYHDIEADREDVDFVVEEPPMPSAALHGEEVTR